MADVKGDVAGLAAAGTLNEKLQARIDEIGIDGYTSEASPVIFWDLYGKLGHPVRTTVSEVGPTLLARMLELNDTQSGEIGRATSELQSLMRISYAVLCLKKNKQADKEQ